MIVLVPAGSSGSGDLTDHLAQSAERILRGIAYTMSGVAGPALNRLPLKQRWEVVLMFKEVLHNLPRPAKATTASIELSQSGPTLAVMIEDNGRGFDPCDTRSD